MQNQKIAAVIGILFLAGIFLYMKPAGRDTSDVAGYKIRVFKSPTCTCCDGWIKYLEKNGFRVEVINTQDLTWIKAKYQIPPEMQSCHTAIMGDYFVEGHVPIKAVKKLLEEKPVVDGIALPGMPLGSPGMPGMKTEMFEVYALIDGTPMLYYTE
jgi:hypothetical protein